MKIEIWCEGKDLHGNFLSDIITVRVPSDIKIINSEACNEMIRRRRFRIIAINKYRYKYNEQFRNETDRAVYGKDEIVDKLYTTQVKGWSPIITTDALEFICQKL